MKIKEEMFKKYPFDDLLLRIVESGIINHWKSLIIDNRKNLIFMTANTLTLLLMSGAFLLWTVGIIVSLLYFLLECFVSKKFKSLNTSSKKQKFWTWANKMIDSKRQIYLIRHVVDTRKYNPQSHRQH